MKAQQVKALGEIGSPVARDTLAQISEESGRIGVIAAGSLIAVGDASAKAKLDAAVAAPKTELRLAAVEAAAAAKNPIVVPTLKTGVADRVLEVRFAAAEGLAVFNAEKATAVPVLEEALKRKDLLPRAMAALLKFGEQFAAKVQTPAEMLESADPKQRLAAVPIVRAMPPKDGIPLLRRLVADPDPEVRRAGVAAIASIASRDKDQAIGLYKPLARDADPVVRSKAQGQLARRLAPVLYVAALSKTPQKTAQQASTPAFDNTSPKVQATAETVDDAKKYARERRGDPQIYIAAADTAIAMGDLAGARNHLDRARKAGAKSEDLDYSYAQLYDKMAAYTQDPAEKRKLLQQAEATYKRFASTGTGARVQRAIGRVAEIEDKIKALGPP